MAKVKGPRPGGTVESVIRLHRRGMVPCQIAEELGVSLSNVRTALSRYGYKPHRVPTAPLADVDDEEARSTPEQAAAALWNYFDERRRALQKEVAYWKARATAAHHEEPR
ncbi:hypothetical protein [Arthrobacter sp.]|uniref:hypothetical protein n=1 Tax=Arthrobacter sp. TaxID=1667 RepID=UPI003A8DD69D